MQEMLQEINCASDMQETGNKTLAIMGSESSDFSGPLGREISPPPPFLNSFPNNNKFCLFFECFSHFLSSKKQFVPLNYISRQNPRLSKRERNTFRNICTLDTTTEKVFGSITVYYSFYCASHSTEWPL